MQALSCEGDYGGHRTFARKHADVFHVREDRGPCRIAVAGRPHQARHCRHRRGRGRSGRRRRLSLQRLESAKGLEDGRVRRPQRRLARLGLELR
eukprot:132911-Pleurochrysis_carterae.AAC.1